MVTKNAKKVHDLAVNVVVCLYRGWLPIEQHGSRSTERLAIMFCLWKEWKKPFEVAVFAAIPAKCNELTHPIPALRRNLYSPIIRADDNQSKIALITL